MLEGLESRKAWEEHLDVYVAALKPEGPVETRLAEQIASLDWRIGRAEAFLRDITSWSLQAKVRDLLDHKDAPKSESHKDMDVPSRLRWLLDGPHANHPLAKEILSLAQRNAFPEAKILDLVIRYSGALERALNQADRKLGRLQDRRWAAEDRAERKADRAQSESRVEGKRAEAKRLLELAMIDPRDPEKGFAFEQEMDRLEREKPTAPATTPPPALDLASFGREAVKAAPVATSVASAAAAKTITLPPILPKLSFMMVKVG